MQRISKSISVTTILILIILVGYFGAYSQWNKLAEARTAFDATKTENERLKQADLDVSTFLSKYQANRDKAEKAIRTLPVGDADVPYLLDNFSKMVTESGLKLISVNIADGNLVSTTKPAAHSIQSTDMDLAMTGPYEAYNDFLLRLQRSLRLVDLLTMNVGVDQSAKDGGKTLEFSLRIRTYYQQ